MSSYRRLRWPGGTYFFTVACAERQWLFREPHHVAALCDALRSVRACDPFETLALVVMPDHLHCIWRLPQGDTNFSVRWEWVKKRTARALHCGTRAASVWQPRFWEHLIRDEADLARHVDYIHFNPVKHGWVLRARDWPYSSLHRFVREGKLAPDWGISAAIDGQFGE